MRRRLMLIGAGLVAVAAFALGGAAFAGATQGEQGDEGETTLSGPAAERAKDAALKATGGGSVNELEQDREGARAYEVEVKKAGGATVEVDLNSVFKVVAVDGDNDGANENETADKDDNDKGDANENEQGDKDDANENEQDDKDDKNEQNDNDD